MIAIINNILDGRDTDAHNASNMSFVLHLTFYN